MNTNTEGWRLHNVNCRCLYLCPGKKMFVAWYAYQKCAAYSN